VRKPLLLIALTLVLVVPALHAQAPAAAKVYGAATPQDVIVVVDKAIKADDFASAVPMISPEGRKALASEGVMGLMVGINFSDPDDPMPGGTKPTKAVLDKKRKDYRTAIDTAKQMLKPYGMDTLIGKPPMSAESEKAISAGLEKADTVALMTSLISTMEKIGPLLGMPKGGKAKVPFKFGQASDYKITGDKATAKAGADTLDFVKIDGRWYLTPPASKGK
jgi:hypothetical protein